MKNKAKGILSILIIFVLFSYGFVAGGISDVSTKQSNLPDTLIPGGNLIGLKFYIDGVHILKLDSVETESGKKSPAKIAGLKVGDYIKEVNSIPVYTNEDLIKIIQFSEDAELTIERNGYKFKVKITPAISKDDGDKKLGIWVRDSTAGIGTVTFYNPENKTFGALGHAITDQDTGKILLMKNASTYNALVTTIRKGKSGDPGELGGVFLSDDRYLGELFSNSPVGIFGSYNILKLSHSPVPVASQSEISEGDATIYCCINGEEINQYKIEISKIIKSSLYTSKGMVIRITDPKLLEKTEGIVQGMSGSPIIQNGKLVGAITHVFVNDPTRGYGIFIENMLTEMEKAN